MEIKHDFHFHTFYSNDADKTANIENYVKIAKEIGYKKLGVTEHFWDDKIEGAFDFYKPLTYAHVSQVKADIERFNSDEVKLYFGAEVEYNPAIKAPAITEETAEKFDFIIVPHSHVHETCPAMYTETPARHLEYLLEVYDNIIESSVGKYILSMAHPFELVRCPYSNNILIDMVSDDTFKRMFEKTAKKDIAVEINAGAIYWGKTDADVEKSSRIRMFRLAKEAGCKFTFGSDAHFWLDIKRKEQNEFLASLVGLSEDDIAPFVR